MATLASQIESLILRLANEFKKVRKEINDLPKVAHTGSYEDLVDKPSLGIPDFSNNASTTSGLVYGYKAGVIRKDSLVRNFPSGTVVLKPNKLTYIQVNEYGVTSNTNGFDDGYFPLAVVGTDTNSITSMVDKRSFVSLGHTSSTGSLPDAVHTVSIVVNGVETLIRTYN